ncbi:MAG: histone deacetylase [bacterium]|nr:histone deacetylase [bacterium]
MNGTALIYHKDYLLHDIPFHPERKERLIATLNYFEKTGVLKRVDIITPNIAEEKDILRVHSKNLLEKIKEISLKGRGSIDVDTLLNSHTYKVALLAAGGVILAADLVLRGEYKNSFALIRPPGHHATIEHAMGFCYFNNVAIAVNYLREVCNIKRVCIMDWDAHAANGTMDIFYKTRDVFNISIHQDPSFFYPGTGFIEQSGEGEGKGYTINIPMEEGASNNDYYCLLKEFVIPKIKEFNPEFIIISSGCDSHKDDNISSLCLNEEGYAVMSNLFVTLSEELCQGRLVIALEGGYNLEALVHSNYEIVRSLLGESEYGNKTKGDILNSTYNTLKKLQNIF